MSLELKVIWDLVGSGYTVGSIISTIEKLLMQEVSIVRNIADAHRESALQAIESAKKGNKSMHLVAALVHLRFLFNFLGKYAERRPNIFEWLDHLNGLSSRDYDARDSYEEMIEFAVLISLVHSALAEIQYLEGKNEDYEGEKQNAIDWSKVAMDTFSKYRSMSMKISSHPTLKGGYPMGYYREDASAEQIVKERESLQEKEYFLKKILSGNSNRFNIF